MKIINVFKNKYHQKNHLISYTQNFIISLLNLQNKLINKKDEYILRDISFQIEQGSINMIIGPNGAGKSSLAKIIANLDKNYQGRILHNFKNIGYLPQNILVNHTLPIDKNTLQNIIKSCKYNNLDIKYSNFTLDKINNLIKHIVNKQIHLLSGGSFKRILLHSIFMNNYDFIILDEPNQNLDLESEEILYDIILHLKKEYNITFIIISHDLYTVMKYADKVICLNNHICCKGIPNDIIKDAKFVALYAHAHKFCNLNHI
ncbi:MAG: ATP-binding cassette domain-containing protein [Rickettsiales bacterium]